MNNISFTSNINFVSPRQFKKAVRLHSEYIPFENYAKGKFSSVTSNFHTTDIRTCTAGGVSGDKIVKGFHIKDSYENISNLSEICDTLVENIQSPFKNVLLIGSKEFHFAPYSRKIFTQLKDFFMNKSENLSFFEAFTDTRAEANIHYSLQKDTWTINAQIFDPEKENYYSILNKEDLLKSFKNISIGKNDKLYLNGIYTVI